MNIRRFAMLSVAFFIAGLPVFSLGVDEEELKSTGSNDSIVFVNYTGPHSKIDSLASIKKLGSDLGMVVAQDLSKAAFYADYFDSDTYMRKSMDIDLCQMKGDQQTAYRKTEELLFVCLF